MYVYLNFICFYPKIHDSFPGSDVEVMHAMGVNIIYMNNNFIIALLHRYNTTASKLVGNKRG